VGWLLPFNLFMITNLGIHDLDENCENCANLAYLKKIASKVIDRSMTCCEF
jgi:hypothetical protein